MNNLSTRPRLGVLALTLEFYEQFAPGLRPAREAWLRGTLTSLRTKGVDIEFGGAAWTRDQIDETIRQLEAADVDALLLVLLTYSPSQIALPALARTKLPVVVWNTQELLHVDETFSIQQMIDNHGVHGTQDLCSALVRSGVRFEYVTSHPYDENAFEALIDFAHAAAAVRQLRSARVGLLGYPFPGMGDFAVDTTNLAASLGCSWVHLAIPEYVKLAAAASADEVNKLVATYCQTYELAKDLTPHDLCSTARAELAVRQLIGERRLNAFSFQFLALGEDDRVSTVPFVAASRLMAEGVGFAGEGDVVGALATFFFNALQPPATFSEMFTIDFTGNALFMSHMGEANVAMARHRGKVPLVARPVPITPTRDRQLTLVVTLEPGHATLAALAIGPGGRWRIIAAPVTIDNHRPLRDFYVPHFKISPAQDVREFLTSYAKAGGPHHNAIIFGDARPRLQAAAAMLNADYIEL